VRKEFFLVCSSLFLLIFGTYVSGSILVPYARSMGGTALDVGIVYSSMFVVRLVLGAPIGRLADRRGVKTVLALSMALYPFVAVAYWFSTSIPTLIGARLLHGIGSAMTLPMAMAYIAQVSPKGQEGRYMSMYTTIMHFAAATGPIVGGVIYDAYGERASFGTLFALAILSLFIVVGFTKHDLGKPTQKNGSDKPRRIRVHPNRVPGWLTELKSNQRLAALSVTNVSVSILLAMKGATFTQLALSYGFSMTTIGMLAALFSTVVGVSQMPLGRLCDCWNKPKVALFSGIAVAGLVSLYPMMQGALTLGILITLAGCAAAVFLASVMALSAVLGKEGGMGKTMGFLGSATSAGNIAGYMVLGFITDYLGIKNAFYATSLLFLIGTLFFYTLWTGHAPGRKDFAPDRRVDEPA
jgi:MFS family permease